MKKTQGRRLKLSEVQRTRGKLGPVGSSGVFRDSGLEALHFTSHLFPHLGATVVTMKEITGGCPSSP